jgi:acyl dehydratase
MSATGETRTLAIGDELPPVVIESVDAQRMKTMAALLDDPNPIHYDVDLVRSLGYGDAPINQGPITMGFLMNVALGVVGARGLRRFGTRFLGNVFAGERVTCRGTVTSVDERAQTAEVALEAFAGDRQVLAGSATISPAG